MRKLIGISVIGLILFGMTSTTSVSLPEADNITFKAGEKLKYRVSYGLLDAGEAVLTVNKTSRKGTSGRPLFHVKGEGKTLSVFNWFFKVHDVYESYIDKEGAFPWYFERDVNEGGYEINQKYTFHQHKQKVVTEKETVKVPTGIQDMFSAFYYARTLDYQNMQPGDEVSFKLFMDGEIWPLKIRYEGKETIKIRAGEFECLKFIPIVQEGDYFSDKDGVQFWVTDDVNRIPVLVKAKIAVGSIKMHLVDWEGLKGTLAKK